MQANEIREKAREWIMPAGCSSPAEGVRLRAIQALALSVPLVVAPRIFDSAIDLPKRLMLDLFLLIGWAALAGEWISRGRMVVRRTGLNAPMGFLVGSAFLSSFLAINPWMGVDQSVLLLAYAFLVWGISSGLGIVLIPRLLSAVLSAGGGIALYGILQYGGIDFMPWSSSWGSRCFGTLGNPIFFAEFIAPILILAVVHLAAEENEERKDLMGLLVLVLFLALLFAQTRSAWLGSLAGLTVAVACIKWLAPDGRSLLVRNRAWLVSAAVFAVAVSLTISSQRFFGKSALPLRDRLHDMVNMKGWTVRHRLVLWKAGAIMLRDAPFFGVGPAHFRSYFPGTQAIFRPKLSAKGFYFPPKEAKSHNDYVQVASETGLAGLGILLWAFVAVGRTGLLAVRRAASSGEGAIAAGLLGGCTALVIDAFFNFPFDIIPASAVFWTFAGCLTVMAGSPLRESPVPFVLSSIPLRRGAWLISGSVAAVLLVWTAWPRIASDRATAEGNYYFDAGMWEMAQGGYERALAWTPHDAMINYKMGMARDKGATYDWSGRAWDRALTNYRNAEKLGLHDELLYGRMAILFERKGSVARAALAGRESVRIYPENADNLSNLAYWLLVRNDSIPEALGYAEKAVLFVPNHPMYLWTYGLVLEKVGRRSEAQASLDLAFKNLDLFPNGRAIYQADLLKDIARVRGR